MRLGNKTIFWDKHCLVYCGDERCDCGANASPWERELHRQQEEKRAELMKKIMEHVDVVPEKEHILSTN